MLRVRTIVGAMLGLAFALTASMPVAAPAAPAVPPDGTYTYALAQGGNPVGTSTVTIAHAGAVLVVRERAMLGAATYETRATFDPATLQETHYTVHAAPADVDVDFSGTTARMHLPGAMLPLPAPNGSALVVSDGLVSSFALLPALHKALGPIAFATTVRPHVTPLTFGPAAAARPANVPANDVGFDATSDTGTYTLWYDPATLVLAYFGYPALSFTYRLTGSTSTVGPESAASPLPFPSPSPSPIALSRARYASREVRFTSRDGTTLAGTLTVPNDARGPVAAVVLVHGSGPLDRDETIGPNKIFLQIAHALSNRNFAVLRYDKRGIGASGGRYIGATRQELLADAEAAVAFAAHDPAIDPQRVFVLGHSEGAELAPSVAADVPAVRGIVLLGAPALPLDQVLIKQVTRGLSGAPLNDAREKAAREYEQIKTGGNADPSAPWLRSWFGVDPAALIARVPCPILVMQGGKDIQVLPADMPRLVDAARAAGRDVTVRFFPDDDHLFIDVPGDAPSTGAEYLVPAALDPAMLTAAADWLAAHNVRLVPSH